MISYRAFSSSYIVSLFVRLWVEILKAARLSHFRNCQPLREAVSWNCPLLYLYRLYSRCQPLREAVSWNPNLFIIQIRIVVSLFVRLWVEIRHLRKHDEIPKVSLFVRLWVEIGTMMQLLRIVFVSLFVRLWVEMLTIHHIICIRLCQPLREAVSWNATKTCIGKKGKVSLFVRLWVEMLHSCYLPRRSPSASSWGCELK